MEKVKVVIVDDNKEFCQIVSKFISNESEFEVIGIANDGVEAPALKSKYISS